MTNSPLKNKLKPSRTFIAERLEEPFNSVLEVGCQWGENLLAIQQLYKGKRLVGVDIDKEKLAIARKDTKGIKFVDANLFNLPFARDEFDIVFTNALFCMLRPVDVEEGIRQIIKLASKKIYMIELMKNGIGYVGGGRTGADYVAIFRNYCIEAKAEKLSEDVFGCEPWNTYGYFIEVTL
jgi:hypothetical protein